MVGNHPVSSVFFFKYKIPTSTKPVGLKEMSIADVARPESAGQNLTLAYLNCGGRVNRADILLRVKHAFSFAVEKQGKRK